MNSEQFHKLVKGYRESPVAMSELSVPQTYMTRIAAWLMATYGDVAVSTADFATEEQRLELAKRVGQQEIALSAQRALDIDTDDDLEGVD